MRQKGPDGGFVFRFAPLHIDSAVEIEGCAAISVGIFYGAFEQTLLIPVIIKEEGGADAALITPDGGIVHIQAAVEGDLPLIVGSVIPDELRQGVIIVIFKNFKGSGVEIGEGGDDGGIGCGKFGVIPDSVESIVGEKVGEFLRSCGTECGKCVFPVFGDIPVRDRREGADSDPVFMGDIGKSGRDTG